MFNLSSFFKIVLLPLLCIALLAPWSGLIDLKISHYFFSEGTFQENPFYHFIYTYGIWPGWIVIAVTVIGAIFSTQWRKPALYLFLCMAIGSGLFIHLGLKEHWGRPRPRQTIEFGGSQPFRPFYSPQTATQPEPSKSFSCGHCSVGFYFFSVAFLGLYLKSKKIYWTGLSLAWGLGILLSLTRIAQGGHFFFDTVVSALIMWWTAYGLDLLILKREQKK